MLQVYFTSSSSAASLIPSFNFGSSYIFLLKEHESIEAPHLHHDLCRKA